MHDALYRKRRGWPSRPTKQACVSVRPFASAASQTLISPVRAKDTRPGASEAPPRVASAFMNILLFPRFAAPAGGLARRTVERGRVMGQVTQPGAAETKTERGLESAGSWLTKGAWVFF